MSAFDYDPLDPGKSKLLGHTQTNNQGYYRINYKADQFLKPEDKELYLLIQAMKDNKLVASNLKQNAGQSEIIEFYIF